MTEHNLKSKKIKILVIAYWPLGGIRTYMKYLYKYLSKECFDITIFAQKTHEESALCLDTKENNCKLVTFERKFEKKLLFCKIFKMLKKERFVLIQSHGFISAVHTYLANMFFKIPHILTVHGIVEKRLMGKNIVYNFKQGLLKKTLDSVDTLYAVSEDILSSITNSVKIREKVKKIAIHNGIDTEVFRRKTEEQVIKVRNSFGIPETIFLIGFFGRFMPQKGFNYLIDAVKEIDLENRQNNEWKVLTAGSGDYLREYRNEIKLAGLENRFIFIPFQRDIASVYQAVDLVVMPSNWEAFGLQAAEAMCLGVPIIVSDCIGLRECVQGTPAIIIPSGDVNALANEIMKVMKKYTKVKNEFDIFSESAREKYDVRKTASKVAELFKAVAGKNIKNIF